MNPDVVHSLVAGGFAGTCVDVALFPLDTVKTRLQAKGGFWKSGGFSGIYRGVSAAALGSWPNAALFFAVYESMKPRLQKGLDYVFLGPTGVKNMETMSSYGSRADAAERNRMERNKWREDLNERYGKTRYNISSAEELKTGSPASASSSARSHDTITNSNGNNQSRHTWLAQSSAASLGEVVSCLVRVPTENIKQKMQVSSAARPPVAPAATASSACASARTNRPAASPPVTFFSTAKKILDAHGRSPRGFYTGFSSTIAREVPFAFIQFPIYEGLKKWWAERNNLESCSPLEGAFCGSCGGAVAACVTTPVDVAKTRLMTAGDKRTQSMTMRAMLAKIVREEGCATLFAGLVPRTMWIALGGFVFFGAYEAAKAHLRGAEIARGDED
eukprot:g7567.t1